jgi:putative endonuclease
MSHTPLIPAKAGIQKATRDTETLHTLPMSFFVYILANRRNGTLYIGMTDDLTRRYFEHRIESRPGFTKRYGVKILVWYEEHGSCETAFERERQLKKWNRTWKLRLIERSNPEWRDLRRDFLP